jgi:hypothetical protein
MDTTIIIVIIIVLILIAVGGYFATRPKTEAEVDGELQKEVTEAESELEEKTADLQQANEELAEEPSDEKAEEVAKKLKKVKQAEAKAEEAKVKQAVVTAQKVDCKVGDWGEYSQCELVDGVWKKKKTRSILTPASGGGVACPSDLEMKEVCKKVNCEMNSWSDFNECKQGADGVWRKSRNRTVKTEPMYGGDSCGALTENQDCGIDRHYYPNLSMYTSFPNQGSFYIKNIGKIGDMCVDDNGATTAGQFKMTTKKCDVNRKNQLFTYDATTKQIKSVNTPSLCVDDGGGGKGSKFHLWTCDPDNANQRFEYDSDKKLIKSSTKANLCFDDDGGKGETFHLWDCDGNNKNQRYSLYAPGTLGPLPFSKGRYVSIGYINRSSPSWLHVGSLEVFDINNNLISRGKSVKQTSDHSSGSFPATKAIDEDWVNSFSHTNKGANEFLEIDLGQEYEISRIVVYNRWDDVSVKDRLEQAKIIISTTPNRANPVYISEELTSALIQWVYPPSIAVHEDNDHGYGNRPRGFYRVLPSGAGGISPLVRCRYVGDGANIRMSCATPDSMYLDVYNGKKIEDILGDSVKTPSNFIRMFRQDVPKSNF